MKILIVQFDDRPFEELGKRLSLVNQNAAYAKLRGYDHIFHTTLGEHVASYWGKVFVTEHYLRNGYDIVAWLDTDAVVHDNTQRIEDYFAGDEAFVYAPDSPPWHGPFNAGVFFSKGIRGLQLMQEWASHYRPDMWEKESGKWRCKSPEWSGPFYEQGAFYINLLPKYRDTGVLKQCSWKVLQSPYPQPESFIVHFAGEHLINILIYLRS